MAIWAYVSAITHFTFTLSNKSSNLFVCLPFASFTVPDQYILLPSCREVISTFIPEAGKEALSIITFHLFPSFVYVPSIAFSNLFSCMLMRIQWVGVTI